MSEEEPFQVVVTNVEEHEDGAATYSFAMDDKAQVEIANIGLEFMLYCASYGLDLQYVLENLDLIAEHQSAGAAEHTALEKEESKSEG
jgi:hypothetical protein